MISGVKTTLSAGLYSLAVASVLAAGGARSDQGWGVEALMHDLASSGQPPLHFTETRHSAFLDIPVVSHGMLRLLPDGTLEKERQAPFFERFSVDRTHARLDTAERTQTLPLADLPALRSLIEGLRALFRGDLPALSGLFDIQLNGVQEGWQLRLEPRDPALAPAVEHLLVSGDGAHIVEVETLERDGDSSRLELTYPPR